ncbi:MAG: rane or secreted protein [Segetibacter sp.]|nr:rane or secreted protein [Segetibacter sp.]
MYYLLVLFTCIATLGYSQTRKINKDIYVDKQGVIRYKGTNTEAAFFGVNYTAPFAYGYRSVKRMGVEIEKAIDDDVYHFSRLGLDAFRVHVWDTEITDSAGNLLENEHLRLFDYLVAKLKERNIKVLITPIAFWGNGYPETDENTGSFSSKYGKQKALVNDTAIRAQENYLKQFFKHVNQYTKTTYGRDENVIAMEINNEPHHTGPKAKTTEYVDRMTTAVKSTGWTKPIFYNISESPSYADAVANAKVNGHSFQWYPTGLVANRTLQGNFLPNVDLYKIPFGDTIPLYRNRGRMVYEFDAGDVLQSNMYPAMARSFRTAGFQWATQFAYDPLATAYANTEYQTHYVNLAYTPAKAISLLIASKVFHKIPRLKTYGTYPADSAFDAFRVSYKNNLSEMNADDAFYYSNSTSTQPKAISNLKHVAGVGSSPVVVYNGYGAYFLDKVIDGVWRLEVMPDAIHIRDPFERASPKKEVTAIQWQRQQMQLMLPGLGTDFKISALNAGNNYSATAIANQFTIEPGTYLIIAQTKLSQAAKYASVSKEFVAPKKTPSETFVVHTAFSEVTGKKPFTISSKIVGVDTTAKVTIELRNLSNKWSTIAMLRRSAYDYFAEVPADMVTPGLLNYRIIIQKGQDDYVVFPGANKGSPFAWDAFVNETYQTYVAAARTNVNLFDPTTDRSSVMVYNPDWRNNSIEYIAGTEPRQLVLKATVSLPSASGLLGFQYHFKDKIRGRVSETNATNTLVVRARTAEADPVVVRIALVTADAAAYATTITLTNSLQDIEIPITGLKPDSTLLLPRPYPGFLPLWFKAGLTAPLRLDEVEKVELTLEQEPGAHPSNKPLSIEVTSISLLKK